MVTPVKAKQHTPCMSKATAAVLTISAILAIAGIVAIVLTNHYAKTMPASANYAIQVSSKAITSAALASFIITTVTAIATKIAEKKKTKKFIEDLSDKVSLSGSIGHEKPKIAAA